MTPTRPPHSTSSSPRTASRSTRTSGATRAASSSSTARREDRPIVASATSRPDPTGDALVLNETRVFPARLLGRRAGGGHAEVLLLHPVAGGGEAGSRWEALVRPGSKLKAGKRVHVSDELDVEIEDVLPSGNRVVRLLTNLPEDEALERYGRIPLPPYVEREPSTEDAERYQTVFARERGSVAAPTAGLHFTRELLDALERKGVRLVRLILHVGIGTFRPVEVEDPAEHPMHAERYSVSREAADAERGSPRRRRSGPSAPRSCTPRRSPMTTALSPGAGRTPCSSARPTASRRSIADHQLTSPLHPLMLVSPSAATKTSCAPTASPSTKATGSSPTATRWLWPRPFSVFGVRFSVADASVGATGTTTDHWPLITER